MTDLRSEVCVILQRVKYVTLGGSLEPLADEIIALVRAYALDALIAEAIEEYKRGETVGLREFMESNP